MKPVQELAKILGERLPGADTELLEPRDPDGGWMLNIELDRWIVVVDWLPTRGFGITAWAVDDEDFGFGMGSEEIYPDESFVEIAARVEVLLRAKRRTSPPSAVALRELRARLNLSQVEVAKRAECTQGAISKLERRDDMSISVLTRIVRAMGGDLELWVRFPNDAPVRLLPAGATARHPPSR